MISVVVPLYNEGNQPRQLVAHVQQVPGLAEVILVDASDQPESKSVLEKLRKEIVADSLVRLIECPVAGRAGQMNAGARLCHGPILLFLHCDTRLPATAAEQVEQCVAQGSVWGRFDVRLNADGLFYRLIERMINLRSRLRPLATGDQAMFVQKAVFQQIGGFAEIQLMEDVELSLRLRRAGPPGLIRQPVLTSARRWQRNGITRTILLMWKLRLLYWAGISPSKLSDMYRHVR